MINNDKSYKIKNKNCNNKISRISLLYLKVICIYNYNKGVLKRV